MHSCARPSAFRPSAFRPFTRLLPAAAVIAALAAPAAHAGPLVQPDSTYVVLMSGTDSGGASYRTWFDHLIGYSTRTFANGTSLQLSIREQQTEVSDGHWTVSVDVETNGDLFPVLGETGYFNIDIDTEPLQLLESVQVNSAVLSMYDGAGTQLDSFDFIANVPTGPWDGYFTKGFMHGFLNIGGRGTQHINATFDLTRIDTTGTVPEPATAAIALTAIGLLATQRRRRS